MFYPEGYSCLFRFLDISPAYSLSNCRMSSFSPVFSFLFHQIGLLFFVLQCRHSDIRNSLPFFNYAFLLCPLTHLRILHVFFFVVLHAHIYLLCLSLSFSFIYTPSLQFVVFSSISFFLLYAFLHLMPISALFKYIFSSHPTHFLPLFRSWTFISPPTHLFIYRKPIFRPIRLSSLSVYAFPSYTSSVCSLSYTQQLFFVSLSISFLSLLLPSNLRPSSESSYRTVPFPLQQTYHDFQFPH